ncbi:hypothetical protein ACFCQI_01715 [Rhodanobacter sp. FW102-FHT14D06]|uniref:Uncharacterized protein n=2 Tax=unclassified Rhodanobacter TaxID=2621553 RepID=A0AB74UQV7_9GAMM
MARIRSIKPEFWSSEQVMECSPTARLLFIGLWNFCDDAGNHSLSVRTIKAEIFPGDDIDSSSIRGMLDELSSNGLIVFYSSENKDFLHVTGWQHQRIDKPTFKHPPYRPENSAMPRRTVDDSSTPERRGEERRGEEGKGEECEGNHSPGDLLGGEDGGGELTDEVGIVVATYNATLPDCQSVQVLNPKRRKRILAVCKLARKVCRQQGWPYTPEGFWTAYWTECSGDDWLAGRKKNPNNSTWKQNIDVLLEEDRFAKVMDQAIGAMRGDA